MGIKVLITDVDGTLTKDDKALSAHALEGISIVKSAGLKVGLASALPYVVLKYLAVYLGVDPIIIGESGGVIDVYNRTIILGSKEEAAKALAKLRRVFKGKVRERWGNEFRLTDLALERNIPYNEVCSAIKDFKVKVVDTKYAYHIIYRGVDKGVGLKKVCQLLNISCNDVAVIGDSNGDLEMFKIAGIKLAPANASRSIKEVADYVSKYSYGLGFKDCVKWLIDNLY